MSFLSEGDVVILNSTKEKSSNSVLSPALRMLVIHVFYLDFREMWKFIIFC